MQQNPGIKGATLDPRRQILTVFATSDAHIALLQIVDEFVRQAQGRPCTDANVPECCVCFCPIESTSDVFRLEDCGHSYCLDCIQMQVTPQTIDFPLQCAADQCSQQFVWQDLENLFQRSSFTQWELVAASLKCYVNANKKTVCNCPTPDCDMVYVISDDGKRFICSHCGVAVCTKCHVQYHDGLSCVMYQAGKHGGKEFEEWMRKDPRNRKRCPNCTAPIEKITGCNKMRCSHCKASICWVCLKYFDTGRLCYAHLVKEHGSFI